MPSQVIGQVDVSAASGSATVNIVAGWVRFYNHSIFGLTLTLSDGQQFYVPPQKRRTICLSQAVGNFTWMRPLVISFSPASAISSFMVIETLDPSDVHLENDLHDLGGAGNVGNTLPVVTAQRLQDDSDPTGTTFIESSISGTQHWNGTVDGGLTLTQVGAVIFEIIKSLAGGTQTFMEWSAPDKKTMLLTQDTNGAWHWRDSTDSVDLITMNNTGITFDNGAGSTNGAGGFLGTLFKVFQNTTSADQTAFDALDQKAGGKEWALILKQDGSYYFKEIVGGNIPLQLFADGSLKLAKGVDSIAANGGITAQGITLINGSGGAFTGQTGGALQAFSKFTGTTTGTYSHGLGIAPTHVDPEQHAVGSSSFGWDSETSTQVHITNFNGAAFSAMAFNI